MKLESTAVGSRSQNCVRAPERETSENSPAGLFSYFNSKDFDSALNLYPLIRKSSSNGPALLQKSLQHELSIGQFTSPKMFNQGPCSSQSFADAGLFKGIVNNKLKCVSSTADRNPIIYVEFCDNLFQPCCNVGPSMSFIKRHGCKS
ncbi:hypothetical protein DNTS_005475 [Danionella cerebrum]|uniref:Uncharacterized protein n=1 Tax=Danionella cerebrum TaxID=2873325 RepID=A0A553MUE9_9TELE|nr:hypothetical protein DNTS_005475 [Danionella translucida]